MKFEFAQQCRKSKQKGTSKMYTGFRWGNLEGKKLENLGIDGKIILKSVLNKLGGRGVNYPAKNRDTWRDLVKTIIYIQVTQNAGNLWTS
jgi:hypothetical protein